jgi:glycosyltransferase involved in cell wall biosynthesis
VAVAAPPRQTPGLHDLRGRPLRIVVHDFAGHPFQVELSRALAAVGHRVLHLHCASDVTGKGRVARDPADPPTFDVEGLSLERAFRKHHPSGRFVDELAYARLLTGRIGRHRPDVVISANTPLLAQARAQRFCRRRGIAFVFWQQDILSIGMGNVVSREHRRAGALMGRVLRDVERRALRGSDVVVPVSEDFLPYLDRWQVPRERVVVIRNWSPIGEVAPRPRDNPWAAAHGYAGARVALYCGTLGRKHDPALLWALAERAGLTGGWDVVVVAEGHGADWLAARQAAAPNPRLHIHGYQPYADLPDVLATADVLVALLEPDAGVFSVPSKVLTYHCAGRAIVAAVPAENLSARLVVEAGSGRVVSPGDTAGFVAACEGLLCDPAEAEALGRNARMYAERTFPIGGIADRFAVAIARSLGAAVTW